MTTRVIKLKTLTQSLPVAVETSARTFGEFKQEAAVRSLGIDWSSVKLINRADKASFELDESVLPEIDSIMFVTPTKTKSGGYCDYYSLGYREMIQEIKDFKADGGEVPFNYTHATIAQLKEFIDNKINPEENPNDSIQAPIQTEELSLNEIVMSRFNTIQSDLSVIKQILAKQFDINPNDYTPDATIVAEVRNGDLVEQVTVTDLDREARELARRS